MHAMSVAAVGHATVPDAMTALALPTMLTMPAIPTVLAVPAVLAMPVVLAMLVNMRCKQSICLYMLNAQCV